MEDSTLVRALAQSLKASLIETHISWVLLTDGLAFKFKKPVRFPFVDYSTLALRQHFCEEEVRLNQRLAPDLYLGVTRVTGSVDQPVLDGSGPTLAFAVRMRRFAPGALFSEQLAAGTLAEAQVDQLASLLAGFHQASPRCPPEDGFGSGASREAAARAALEGVRAMAAPQDFQRLQEWLGTQARELAPLWQQRQQDGHVRECHGDLHLANIVGLPTGVAAFDGIEFDAALRCIDVLDDLAFAVMDFAAQGRVDLAYRLLNAWLDLTGDHAGLPALRHAVVYRALVRAQVEGLRAGSGPGQAVRARRYLDTALAWLRRREVQLSITCGLPGSGKTFHSQRVLQAQGAVRLRSDVERKRLFGLDMLADSRARGLDLYTADATERTYAYLFDTARLVLRAGFPVVLDAAFLRRQERARALALSRELGVPLTILACEAPLPVLQERLQARHGDASEADVAVLARLQPHSEPLDESERAQAQVVACGP